MQVLTASIRLEKYSRTTHARACPWECSRPSAFPRASSYYGGLNFDTDNDIVVHNAITLAALPNTLPARSWFPNSIVADRTWVHPDATNDDTDATCLPDKLAPALLARWSMWIKAICGVSDVPAFVGGGNNYFQVTASAPAPLLPDESRPT